MRLNYTDVDDEDQSVVALIDVDGDLVFRGGDNMPFSAYYVEVETGKVHSRDWDIAMEGALRKFRRGETLTITF